MRSLSSKFPANLVTGTPGSGKTSLVKYARSLADRRFFDADEVQELCEWRVIKTGRVLGLVSDIKAKGGDAWYAKYGWYWREDVLVDFINSNPGAIISGSSENVVDCYKHFDNIFLLKKTEEELLSNLLNPDRDNPFGKTPEQRKNFMNWQTYLIEESRKYNSHVGEGNLIEISYKRIVSEIHE